MSKGSPAMARSFPSKSCTFLLNQADTYFVSSMYSTFRSQDQQGHKLCLGLGGFFCSFALSDWLGGDELCNIRYPGANFSITRCRHESLKRPWRKQSRCCSYHGPILDTYRLNKYPIVTLIYCYTFKDGITVYY